MEVRLHRDLAEFDRLTGALYGADPVTHTVAITVVNQRLVGTASADDVRTLLTVHGGASLVGAALRTHPWPLVVSALPIAAAPLAAEVLAGHDPRLAQVGGPRGPAEAFAAAWCATTGAVASIVMAHRLFRLDELRPPSRVPGRPRLAGIDDLDLATDWQRAFAEEAVPGSSKPDRDAVRRQLRGGGGTLLWEVHGAPVALARASEPTWGMSRVSAVFTPPSRRGHGYGSAVTAAASQWARDAGARDVVLFTDLENPVSNAIYPRLGYRPVHDAVQLALVPR